ncbi:hypothetical protein IE53DRAFT_365484 [Violaceomyces palustris]|uniref:Uncharacterized protein n=1 Tax=Violaceomyces palustris TaxID=1673888 RepID=A0ACD0P8I6_9BASI|nr:hypothetical protein IE53DRAFT_365484 [Violaceomyces palustris]
MFGGPPPKPSAHEQALARLQTRQTLRNFVSLVGFLYSAPLVWSYVSKLVRN